MKKGSKVSNLNKRLAVSKNMPDKESSEPSTAEEWLENGSFEEECGDRWLGSDLNKSLRFYQKAFDSYGRSLELDGQSNLDAYYNSSRLLFHVYNQYTKAEGVKISDMTQIDEVLRSEATSVVQSLVNIVVAHERSLDVARQKENPPLDLLFNTALIYTEVIESEVENGGSNYASILQKGQVAQQIFGEIVERQQSELKKFISDLENLNENTNTSSQSEQVANSEDTEVKEESYTSEEVLQPTDIFETIIEAYRMSQALIENIDDFDSQANACMDTVNPFLTIFDNYAHELINNFSAESNRQPEFVSSISDKDIDEYKVLKHLVVGLGMNQIDLLISHWNSADLPDTYERYIAAASNFETFLDRNDIDIEKANSSIEAAQLQWRVLTAISNCYKVAQNKLTAQLNEKRKSAAGEVEGIGSLLAHISGIMISRSDVDVQRALINNIEAAVNSKSVLSQNAKTLLKSAMNMANSKGGLRERASEKLQREQRKTECVLRMCILEGKTDIQELDSILGRKRWIEELPNLKKLDFYEHLGASNIIIP